MITYWAYSNKASVVKFMLLSLDDVKRIAHLARIAIDETEAEATLSQLSGIFGLIEDTSGVEPMAHAQDVTLRLREDVVTETDQHALFQSVAPQVQNSLYLVPKVIE
jgi:aspartyl-tRNA(Asn)/glutamyl-tRNA(Gln) amidotransferase subunit C